MRIISVNSGNPKYCFLADVAINNILYIRGIYPEASFKQVKKFGRSVLMTTDEELIDYLDCLVSQVKGSISLL